ncbi:MAG TPA: MFS transporter, partial [Steroidobacteraceae bacterium]|nr:MFS transporter [Steroidobacteraceae bacterium]
RTYDPSQMNTHPAPSWVTYWSLMLGNFVVGVGVLMPAGLLNELSSAFSQDAATTGKLIGYGAALLFIEAPLLAFLTNKMDRRWLLTGALAVYAVGHFASAFAPSFNALMIARLLMIGGAAAFTPQAASAISLLVPPERRATAVAFIFLGWPTALAVGVPLASLMGAYVGWSTAYLIVGAVCSVATLAVFASLPNRLFAPRLSLAMWGRMLTSGKILAILLVTMIFIAGQFTVYPYLAVELKTHFNAAPTTISLLFAVYGISGVVGSIVSSRVIGRIGASATVTAHLAVVLTGLMLWAVGTGYLFIAVVGLVIWGYGGGPAISGQQARLITADPDSASASVALNSSVLYAGQAAGTLIGGELLSRGLLSWNGEVASVLLIIALGVSLSVRRWMQA